MPGFLDEAVFSGIAASLPSAFLPAFSNEKALLARAWPLLDMICPERALIDSLRQQLMIREKPTPEKLVSDSLALVEVLKGQLNPDAPFPYRLPLVLSEFPLHSRSMQGLIERFNRLIEVYHQDNSPLNHDGQLESCYEAILAGIENHGPYCMPEDLWQLTLMLAGWSNMDLTVILKPEEALESEIPVEDAPWELSKIALDIPLAKATVAFESQPFIEDYHYNINAAGRLSKETVYLLLNAFGMKIGGHFDAQVKYSPNFLSLTELHALIARQLSHRLSWPYTEECKIWIEASLQALGLQFFKRKEEDDNEDRLLNPFLQKPLSFIHPETVYAELCRQLDFLAFENLHPEEDLLAILSQYVYELLQGFQFNPGLALGIGANWDGTINLSNEAGAYAYKFSGNESAWASRFKQLSLHRQGPAEARMNAAIGVEYELQALLSDFQHMSQLQPTEYKTVIYNALIDNLVADLFPLPAYFENANYTKYRKNHVCIERADKSIIIESFYKPASQGTYFKDRQGRVKQTPMYRRAGTLDIQAFPRNTTCSEQSKVCYAGNPLGPLQMAYSQAMYRSTRGHWVYHPTAEDQFIEDAFYGQVLRADNGDFLPFIGVVPKNFDRHFHQEKELCASFVLRMMQSAAIDTHCPTFKALCQKIKARFLPDPLALLPELPADASDYLRQIYEDFSIQMHDEARDFPVVEASFFRLFKNLLYRFYDIGKTEPAFRQYYLRLISDRDTFDALNRERCEKLIRDFSVNKPVQIPEALIAAYEENLQCLKALLRYFYPEPSDELAKDLAIQAKIHTAPLLCHPAIKQYFQALKNNRHGNLSRKQSPGMLFAALKHGGPSKSIVRDYGKMHQENFPAYYRDADGTRQGAVQKHERLLDGAAKHLGGFLQLLHRYQLFAIIHRPFSAPYLTLRENLAQHYGEPYQALWAGKGFVEGLFWEGLMKGLWYTATSPILMLRDFLDWKLAFLKPKPEVQGHPLAISAAAANDENMRANASASSRDLLLQWLRKGENLEEKRKSLLAFSHPVLKCLYPNLSEESIADLTQNLVAGIALKAADWQVLTQPLVTAEMHQALSNLFKQADTLINYHFLQAVYQTLTSVHSEEALAQAKKDFPLSKKQQRLLEKTRTFFHTRPLEERSQLIALFQFNGRIYQRLRKRDDLLKQIQSHLLQMFDSRWMRANLLPDLPEHSEAVLLSVKDQAHQQWGNFIIRECRHQFLQENEAEQVFHCLKQILSKSRQKLLLLDHVKEAYCHLTEAADDNLEHFYHRGWQLRKCLDNIKYSKAKRLLEDLMNLSMNAIVNGLLSQGDIFSDAAPENPLVASEALSFWLLDLQRKPADFRSLLVQQLEQSPSLDHALWRYKCIFKVIESKEPEVKLRKTGLQSLLRLWCQHDNNVTLLGEAYRHPQTQALCSSKPSILFQDSLTMTSAAKKVDKKLDNKVRSLGFFSVQSNDPPSLCGKDKIPRLSCSK